jgi:mannosyltransferase OCH1-like enzyme
MPIPNSRAGLWNKCYEGDQYGREIYADPRTAQLAAGWLNIPSIKTVEDWGCGYGGFKNYLAPHQTYIGIDGSQSRFADKIEDLTNYKSKADGIHLRHVLEHNPSWPEILTNFLQSFTQRAVLTLFTPLADVETVIARYPNFNDTGVEMVDISLSENDLYRFFNDAGDIAVRTMKDLNTKSQYGIEHIYLLKRTATIREEASVRATEIAKGPAGPLVQIYTKQVRIFRTIHIVWIGDETRRPDNCIETWRQMNPDWIVRVWGNQELLSEDWQNMQHIREMVTREWNGVADMMRWEILERLGGFAVDADSVCVRPLEDWLFEPDIFACWENEIERPGLIAAGYVYSHPRNALIRQIISDIQDLPDMTGGEAWQLVGPRRLTDTVRKMRYTGITLYPSHYFIPEHYIAGVSYSGLGPIFAKQLWGSTRPQVYDTLARTKISEIVS